MKVHIEIVKYMDKNGSFASRDSILYCAELVGVNGERQMLPDTEMAYAEYDGYDARKYAVRIAKQWQRLLGCKVKSKSEVSNDE